MAKRTVMYSSGGKKLYAVRNADGEFTDIQQYSRAHAMDIKRRSNAEAADDALPTKKKASKKKVAKKAGKKKAAKKAGKKRAAKKSGKKTTKE
jgi:hypothetical protein